MSEPLPNGKEVFACVTPNWPGELEVVHAAAYHSLTPWTMPACRWRNRRSENTGRNLGLGRDAVTCPKCIALMPSVEACAGGCGETLPTLYDNEFGQRFHVSAWICAECHVAACGAPAVYAGHMCKVEGL